LFAVREKDAYTNKSLDKQAFMPPARTRVKRRRIVDTHKKKGRAKGARKAIAPSSINTVAAVVACTERGA
jgi:hypothetical protein